MAINLEQAQNIAVIGDGGWGTTLAIHLANKQHQVMLWGPFLDHIEAIKESRENAKFLPGETLPESIQLTPHLKPAFDFADIIVLATPSQYLKNVLIQIAEQDYKKKIFVSAVKGIDPRGFKTMSDIIREELGKVALAVLSGPTIAKEVAQGVPSTAVMASADKTLREALQQVFHSDTFRIYTNKDVKGVELGGSLKNVIAIACGICDGLGYGTNAKAALLTRGLAEMARLGKAFKAQPETFMGLSGLGDLATTCFSPTSRNRTVGERLGKGEKINAILDGMDMVAEGVSTAQAVRLWSKEKGVSMPITEAVYQVIYGEQAPEEVVAQLLARDAVEE